jgi:hypothetical protein
MIAPLIVFPLNGKDEDIQLARRPGVAAKGPLTVRQARMDPFAAWNKATSDNDHFMDWDDPHSWSGPVIPYDRHKTTEEHEGRR